MLASSGSLEEYKRALAVLATSKDVTGIRFSSYVAKIVNFRKF